MVRVVETRLMRAGEVAVWRNGTLVWNGLLGSEISDKLFDSVSLSSDDLSRLRLLVGPIIDRRTVCAAIASW